MFFELEPFVQAWEYLSKRKNNELLVFTLSRKLEVGRGGISLLHYLLTVMPDFWLNGQSSVRNGAAGSPSRLKRLTSGLSAQP